MKKTIALSLLAAAGIVAVTTASPSLSAWTFPWQEISTVPMPENPPWMNSGASPAAATACSLIGSDGNILMPGGTTLFVEPLTVTMSDSCASVGTPTGNINDRTSVAYNNIRIQREARALTISYYPTENSPGVAVTLALAAQGGASAEYTFALAGIPGNPLSTRNTDYQPDTQEGGSGGGGDDDPPNGGSDWGQGGVGDKANATTHNATCLFECESYSERALLSAPNARARYHTLTQKNDQLLLICHSSPGGFCTTGNWCKGYGENSDEYLTGHPIGCTREVSLSPM